MSRYIRTCAVVIAGAGLSASLLATGSARAVAAVPAIGFGQPTPSGIQGDGYEQDIELDNTTNHEIIYTSGPISTGSVSIIWKSTDGGQTFKEVAGQIPPTGKPLTCVGGGDSELAVDNAGHLYFADLYLGNFSTSRSDNHGATFAQASCTGVPDAGVDRQWYTTVGDPTSGAPTAGLFLAYDRILQSGVACPGSVSDTNALVLARSPAFAAAGATAGGQFSASTVLSCDEGIMGNDVSYTYADHGPRVFVIHDNKALNDISIDRCDDVATSATNPTGLSNCTGDVVVSSFPGSVTGANFPTMSVDGSGGLFAVWSEAPGSRGAITGNTQMYYSTSSDEGTTWSAAKLLPTPGINQAVYAWPGSGDPGRIDVAYYGAPEAWKAGDTAGPDSTVGHYGLYMSQTLDGGATWSAPILASEHFIHYGSMYTLIGSQSGNRALGDFLRMRVGPNGEAEISYADSNNFEAASDLSPEGMYVRQVSGASLFSSVGTVHGTPAPTGNCVTTAAHQATFDANGASSADIPHLHLLGACVTQPDATHYTVTMNVADLTTPLGSSGPGPDPTGGGTTNLWQTQWHVPSSTQQPDGGELWFVYMETVNGGTPTCWTGQSSQEVTGAGGAELTYPGSTQLTGAACSYTATAPGTITITVPTADVNDPGAISNTLYSVTASSQTLVSGNAETPPNTNTQGVGIVGGQFPNLVDVAPAFDFIPVPSVGTPETPWVPALLVLGATVVTGGAVRRRRRVAG